MIKHWWKSLLNSPERDPRIELENPKHNGLGFKLYDVTYKLGEGYVGYDSEIYYPIVSADVVFGIRREVFPVYTDTLKSSFVDNYLILEAQYQKKKSESPGSVLKYPVEDLLKEVKDIVQRIEQRQVSVSSLGAQASMPITPTPQAAPAPTPQPLPTRKPTPPPRMAPPKTPTPPPRQRQVNPNQVPRRPNNGYKNW